LTSAGDVWSLGLVLLELFAGAQISKDEKSHTAPPEHVPVAMRVPWHGMSPSAIYQAAVVDGEVPPQLQSPMPHELHTLIANCLSTQPGARPTASEVLSALLALSKLYPALEANDREAYHRYQVEVTSSGVSLERTMALLQLTGDTAQEFATAQAAAAEESECVVCLDALATHQCNPCGHRCMCAGCSMLALASCPFCREPIVKVERSAK
jgi:serine/threonine protein kinase